MPRYRRSAARFSTFFEVRPPIFIFVILPLQLIKMNYINISFKINAIIDIVISYIHTQRMIIHYFLNNVFLTIRSLATVKLSFTTPRLKTTTVDNYQDVSNAAM